MSEKLDGVRALWDGRRFIFRQGALATALEHVPCEGAPHLQKQRRKIEQAGGEGLMLREPGSAYEAGRSPTLLKVKSFLDAEATVLEHQPGKGRFRGLMGALAVQLADGTRFSVGTGFSENERANPPPIGSVITFRYQELSRSGVPRFPSFVRIASDT